MEFVKMEGLGNDFVVIPEPFEPDRDTVVRWCNRRHGIGADGVLVTHAEPDGSVRMRYWNADGGEVEMCGNGLRCVALLAHARHWVPGKEFVVVSRSGEHPVAVLGAESVRALVGNPHAFRTDRLEVAGHEVHPVGIGNPHAVLFVDDVDEASVETIGPAIETDPLFPDRTNVEFVEVVSDDTIRVRVWERGVGETPASGTGAAAAAFAANRRELTGPSVEVELRGGSLMVELDEVGAWTTGPARVVFSGLVD